jgi:hypothetical protein
VFGHELNTPTSLLFAETVGDTRSEVTDYNKVALKLHREFKPVIHTVAKRMQTVFEREELEETQPPFKAGELCFVRIRCPKHKFSVRYFGPTKIVKSVNDRVYVVDINGEEKVVNIAKLKRYRVNKFSPSQYQLEKEDLSVSPKQFNPAITSKEVTNSKDHVEAASPPSHPRRSTRQPKKTVKFQIDPEYKDYDHQKVSKLSSSSSRSAYQKFKKFLPKPFRS